MALPHRSPVVIGPSWFAPGSRAVHMLGQCTLGAENSAAPGADPIVIVAAIFLAPGGRDGPEVRGCLSANAADQRRVRPYRLGFSPYFGYRLGYILSVFWYRLTGSFRAEYFRCRLGFSALLVQTRECTVLVQFISV